MSSVTEGGNRHDLTADGEPAASDGATDERSVSDDDVFTVLSNCRRREVIRYLSESDGQVSVGELAEHIAVEENGTTHQELSSDERKSVYVSLYQNHLPVMDDAGVVDYAENRKTVELLDGASRLEPYLADATRTLEGREPTALALAVAGCVVLGGLQVGPFAALPAATWTLLGVIALVGIACFDALSGSFGSLQERLSAT